MTAFIDAQLRLDAAMVKYDASEQRDQRGRWARGTAAVGQALRSTGRAIKTVGSAVWAGYRALPFEAQVATAIAAAQATHMGVQYARATPERRAEIRTKAHTTAVTNLKGHLARTGEKLRAERKEQNVFSSGAAAAAGIPFMVTRDMRQQLADKGYKFSEISQMTPAKAHFILSKFVLNSQIGKLQSLLAPAGGKPATTR